jgi:hypothetical protein
LLGQLQQDITELNVLEETKNPESKIMMQ